MLRFGFQAINHRKGHPILLYASYASLSHICRLPEIHEFEIDDADPDGPGLLSISAARTVQSLYLFPYRSFVKFGIKVLSDSRYPPKYVLLGDLI